MVCENDDLVIPNKYKKMNIEELETEKEKLLKKIKRKKRKKKEKKDSGILFYF